MQVRGAFVFQQTPLLQHRSLRLAFALALCGVALLSTWCAHSGATTVELDLSSRIESWRTLASSGGLLGFGVSDDGWACIFSQRAKGEC